MAWEQRKGQLYYYRKERIGDKVVSRYVGKGVMAHVFAMLLEEAQDARKTRAQEKEAWRNVESLISQREQEIKQLLLESGLHRPNWGRWRKRRSSPAPKSSS